MPTRTPGTDPASGIDYIAELHRHAALLRTCALQTAIFNSANFSSIATDAAGVIQIFNVGAARMLGYAAIDVMDKITPADLSDPEELVARAAALSLELGITIAPGFEALVFKASRGIEDIYELTYIRKDGSRLPAEVSVTALRDAADEVIGYLLIGTDNTVRRQLADELAQHRRQLEELVSLRTAELADSRGAAEVAGRAKRTFLAHMSHELRTPMNGIMGMTNLALRLATDAHQIDALTKAAQLGRQMSALVDDLLDISNIETARLGLEERPFSLLRTVSDSVAPFEVPALAKGLSLTLDISPLLPDALWGAATRLQQILGNLVSNAIKFSERGHILVRASPARLDADSVRLRLDVIDEGPGLTRDQQLRLFQVFSQGDDSLTREHGGSGLGLVIARRLAQLMDGDAGVVSAAGVGSNFWVTVRLKIGRPASPAHPDTETRP